MQAFPFALLLLVLPLLPQEASKETLQQDPLPAQDPAITRAELEHHVRILAADALEGRLPATPGMERAAQYLIRSLTASGVEPAGEGGTFLQPTGIRRYEYPTLPRLLFTDEAGATVEAHYGVDFVLKMRGRVHSTETLPLRFFYDYNHSRMPLVGNPAEAIHFSAAKADRKRIFAELGIKNLEDWGLELGLALGEKRLEPGKPVDALPSRLLAADEPDGCELIELRGPLVPTFERYKFTHVQLLAEEVEVPVVDANVVGRIRGVGTAEHPERAQEVVLLSAHYDHLGIRAPRRGNELKDRLCNGADDDASGCAALLELAQALAAGAKPVRTLVFLFTTGEESGATGARRYLAGPAEPLDRTVALLELEMLGRPDEQAGGAGHLWLTGYERTTLGPAWAKRGLAIAADPHPEERFFQRFGHYPFALEGVVAQSLSSFALHEEYHTAKDEPDTLDYAHLEAVARLAQEAVSPLADGSLQPAWLAKGQPTKGAPSLPSEEERESEGMRMKKELRNLRNGDAGERGDQAGKKPGGKQDDGDGEDATDDDEDDPDDGG